MNLLGKERTFQFEEVDGNEGMGGKEFNMSGWSELFQGLQVGL